MTSTEMSSNQEIIGRADINDLEAILSVSASDQHESIRAVKDNAEAIFTWDYEKGRRPALNKLYEKAKVSMWNGETDLPWDTVVDQEEVARNNALAAGGFGDVDLTRHLVTAYLAPAFAGDRPVRTEPEPAPVAIVH